MKIGILGGTFDAVHLGHVGLAEEAQKKLGLDKVVFIPSYTPPHKSIGAAASAEDRYRMAELSVAEMERMEEKKAKYTEGDWLLHSHFGAGQVLGTETKNVSGEEKTYYKDFIEYSTIRIFQCGTIAHAAGFLRAWQLRTCYCQPFQGPSG